MHRIIFIWLQFMHIIFASKNYDGYKVYRLTTNNQEEQEFLHNLDTNLNYDFWSPVNKIGKPVELMVSPEEQNNFENWFKHRNIDCEIINENVGKTYQAQKWKVKPRTSIGNNKITFDRYLRYDEIKSYLAKLAKNYPQLVTLSSAGKSYLARDVNFVKISANKEQGLKKPVIFVDAGIHAREWIAPATALYLINQLVENEGNKHLVEEVDWIVIPSVNPDGYEYSMTKDTAWQKTVSKGIKCDGVDGNRNFDYHWMEADASNDECQPKYAGKEPFSEIEARNLRDVLSDIKNIKAYITLHCYGKYLVYPWGYDEIEVDNTDELEKVGNLMKNAIESVRGTNYTVGNSAKVLYRAGGTSDDWAKSTGVDIVFTLELPRGEKDHGYPVANEEILPVVNETFQAFKALHGYILSKYVKQKI